MQQARLLEGRQQLQVISFCNNKEHCCMLLHCYQL
jgi:hypothetical protein